MQAHELRESAKILAATTPSVPQQRVGDPMKVMFDKFDTDGSGGLDEREFVHACALMGLSFPQTDLVMMFRTADEDGSGQIDVDEFTDLMKDLRWKRMELLTLGLWEGGRAEVDMGGIGMMHNWEEQQKWLQDQIETGQGLSRAGDVHTHADAKKKKMFRARLRTLFDEVDIDHSGALDMDEMRRALSSFGLSFTDDTVREMVKFCDKDGNGDVDYNEFEEAILDIFFNRDGRGQVPGSEWKYKVMQSLESRLRPPPPPRPQWMQNQVGSVKAQEDCFRTDLHGQQIGETAWLQAQTTEDANESMVTLHVDCSNVASVRQKLSGKSFVPSFPCRPVVVMNIEEPRSKVWFQAGFSNWLDGVVHPCEQTITLEHFESVKQIEFVAYDLEGAGDGVTAQEDSGTAMIGLTTLWIPSSTNEHAASTKFPQGTLHMQVIAGLRLPKADVFGLSDPFVVLTIGKQRVATHVEMCTLNPEWGDEFEFQLMGDSELLKLEVFDWDVDANDFLGCTEVNLGEVCSSTKALTPVETWYHLRHKDGTFVWGQEVADEHTAAKLRVAKKELQARKALKSNIVSRTKNWIKDYQHKFTRIAVRDTRNMTASPEFSLGSVKVAHHELMVVLAQAKARRFKAQAHRKAQGANLFALMVRGSYSTGECFIEWREVLQREKTLKYFSLGNHPDKYASISISARDHVDGGHENVRIGVGCRNLPKMDFFGSVDCFLVFEVKDPKSNEWKRIHKTKVMESNQNPEYKPFLTTADSDLHGKAITQIRISAFDWDFLKPPEMVGWVKTNIIELESSCRGGITLKFKDPNPKKNRYRGELVPYDCRLWRTPVFTVWNFVFDINVHSWQPGDAYTITESSATRPRASSALYAAEIHAATRSRVHEMVARGAR